MFYSSTHHRSLLFFPSVICTGIGWQLSIIIIIIIIHLFVYYAE